MATLLFRGGIVLTFTGEDLDVVTQPMFLFTHPDITSEVCDDCTTKFIVVLLSFPNAQGVVCSVKDTNTLECLLPSFTTVDSEMKSNISYTIRYGGAPGPDLTLTELVLHQRPNLTFPEDGSALSPTEFSPGTTGLLRMTVSITW